MKRADRGGLEAALYCNLQHGEWYSKDRKKIETVDEFLAYLQEGIKLYGVSVKTDI